MHHYEHKMHHTTLECMQDGKELIGSTVIYGPAVTYELPH